MRDRGPRVLPDGLEWDEFAHSQVYCRMGRVCVCFYVYLYVYVSCYLYSYCISRYISARPRDAARGARGRPHAHAAPSAKHDQRRALRASCAGEPCF